MQTAMTSQLDDWSLHADAKYLQPGLQISPQPGRSPEQAEVPRPREDGFASRRAGPCRMDGLAAPMLARWPWGLNPLRGRTPVEVAQVLGPT